MTRRERAKNARNDTQRLREAALRALGQARQRRVVSVWVPGEWVCMLAADHLSRNFASG